MWNIFNFSTERLVKFDPLIVVLYVCKCRRYMTSWGFTTKILLFFFPLISGKWENVKKRCNKVSFLLSIAKNKNRICAFFTFKNYCIVCNIIIILQHSCHASLASLSLAPGQTIFAIIQSKISIKTWLVVYSIWSTDQYFEFLDFIYILLIINWIFMVFCFATDLLVMVVRFWF